MTTFRAASEADLASIRLLFERRDGARYDDAAIRRRVASFDESIAGTEIAEVDGRIVAMSTVVLRTLVAGRIRHRSAYWTDLYVHDDYRRHGLYVPLARATLARAKALGAELVLTANRRREVFTAHTKLGFRIAGVAPTRVRPVRALATALGVAGARRIADLAAPLDRAAFALVERLVPRRGSAASLAFGPVDDAAIEALLPLLTKARGPKLGTELSETSLRTRYERPLEGRDYVAVVARRDGDVVGGAIVRTARRGRVELGVVLDLVDGGDAEVGISLVRGIERWAAREGCDAVLVLDGAPDLGSLWDRAGYLTTPEWYVLLVTPASLVADPTLGNASNWRFPFSEHDAF